MIPQTLTDQQTRQFERIVKKSLKDLWPQLEQRLLKLPRTEGGSTLASGGMVEVNRIIDDLEKLIGKSGLKSGLTTELKSLDNISEYIRADIEKQLDAVGATYGTITMPDISRVMKLNTALLDVHTSQGVAALKTALTQSVVFGQSYDQAAKSAQAALAKIGHNALTDVITAQRQYLQDAEDEGARQAQDILDLSDDDLVYRYEGAPLQDNSHPECVWALTEKPDAPYFTNEERNNFEAGITPPHSEPRWNCQHEFVLDIEESMKRAKERQDKSS